MLKPISPEQSKELTELRKEQERLHRHKDAITRRRERGEISYILYREMSIKADNAIKEIEAKRRELRRE